MKNKGSAKKPLKWALLFIGIDVLLELLFEATSSHPAVLPAVLFVVAALIAAILILVGVWRLVFLPRSYRPGHCGHCGYCLTGLTEALCPECGTDFDSRLLEQEEDQENCVEAKHGQEYRTTIGGVQLGGVSDPQQATGTTHNFNIKGSAPSPRMTPFLNKHFPGKK